MTLRIGSVCTGYGGLDMAVRNVFGGELAWVSDIDAGACRIIAHRMPGVPNLGDLTTTRWEDVEPVDIYIGGYPCQPFSTAGNLKGTADERHIWPYIADSLRVLRPRIAIFENVANHLRIGFDTVLSDLARLRFDAEWDVVRADEAGAPHQRRRLILLATATDASSVDAERRGAAGVLGGQAAAEPREEDQRKWAGHTAEYCGEATANAADLGHERSRDTRGGRLGPADCRVTPTDAPCDLRGISDRDPVSARCDKDEQHQATGTGVASDTDSSGQRPNLSDLRAGQPDVAWGAFEPAIHRWERVLGRRNPGPTDDRGRLSPAFVEWMMGLPAGHVTDVPDLTRTAQLKALGNGVVPQQAEAAIRVLAERAGLLGAVAA